MGLPSSFHMVFLRDSAPRQRIPRFLFGIRDGSYVHQLSCRLGGPSCILFLNNYIYMYICVYIILYYIILSYIILFILYIHYILYIVIICYYVLYYIHKYIFEYLYPQWTPISFVARRIVTRYHPPCNPFESHARCIFIAATLELWKIPWLIDHDREFCYMA